MTEYIVNFRNFWIRNDRLITDRHQLKHTPPRNRFECLPEDIWMRYPHGNYYVSILGRM